MFAKKLCKITSNEDDRTKTTQSLFNLRTSSNGGQHRVSELLQKPRGVSSKLSLQIRTPNRIESCQYPRPRRKLFIGNWRKPGVICQHIFFPLLRKRQRRSSFNPLEKALNETSHLTKKMLSIITRRLRVRKIVGN